MIDTAITDIAGVKTVVDAVQTKTDNLPTNTDTELKEIKSLNKHNLAVEFDWDGNDDNNQTDFYGYDTAANTATNDHSTGKLIHITGTTANFTDNKPDTTKFIDADE